MKNLLAISLISIASLCGCASASDHGAPSPKSCDPTDRMGTYSEVYTEQSGNCGPVPTSLVSLNPNVSSLGTGCSLNSERLSEGSCKLERDATCIVDGTKV